MFASNFILLSGLFLNSIVSLQNFSDSCNMCKIKKSFYRLLFNCFFFCHLLRLLNFGKHLEMARGEKKNKSLCLSPKMLISLSRYLILLQRFPPPNLSPPWAISFFSFSLFSIPSFLTHTSIWGSIHHRPEERKRVFIFRPRAREIAARQMNVGDSESDLKSQNTAHYGGCG